MSLVEAGVFCLAAFVVVVGLRAAYGAGRGTVKFEAVITSGATSKNFSLEVPDNFSLGEVEALMDLMGWPGPNRFTADGNFE